jgi:RNA polymerase sigma-B factor
VTDTQQATTRPPISIHRLGVISRPAARRTRDDYGDVPELLRQLRVLPADTPAHDRLRGEIVTRCLPLADHLASRYDRKGENLDDLVQIARVGLMHAINRFDPDSGAPFLAFAVPTMLGEIRRHFRDNGWMMHVPRRTKELYLQIGQVAPTLTQANGRAPTPSELAEALGADREQVVEALVASDAYRVRSIDTPMHAADDTSDRLVDTLGAADAGIDHITNREALRPALAALSERERTVLYLRFFASMSQSQIAERIGVSQMHVSRILQQTLQNLRVSMT